MITRALASIVQGDLGQVPAVALLGPRQVGKTTLARSLLSGRPGTYLDCERPADLARLADADAYLRALTGQLVVIDEAHRVPGLFPVLRGIIDDRRAAGDRSGHFLLLGSASLDLAERSGESLAGRIRARELTGITVRELDDGDDRDDGALWVRGGFPDALLAADDRASLAWREDLVASYLVRDVAMFAPRLPAATISRLWTMLAHEQGGVVNASRLARSLGVSANSVNRYLDLLQDLYLIRLLRPWSGNVGKRLVRAPKAYVRDSGLVHALLRLATLDDVLGHPVAGASYEGWVIEQVLSAAGGDFDATFYRTQAGAEIDLVLERGGRVECAIEVKRSSSPSVSRGMRHALADLQPPRAFVAYPGSERFSLGGGVEAIGVRELVRELT